MTRGLYRSETRNRYRYATLTSNVRIVNTAALLGIYPVETPSTSERRHSALDGSSRTPSEGMKLSCGHADDADRHWSFLSGRGPVPRR
jgi:hypothetical protein